ncbi:phosphoribosylglycinamide formyltransferase [Sulfurimonas sp. SAG-AH-194-C21]|nr:formyltransferase family protein [Sulfurimonas sp. SAG-AH-194-C21]MDF1882627.1 phosphoribosylglycinamide formyltransferase [Sulfurimonas sp. SAG-AH-194-C21]
MKNIAIFASHNGSGFDTILAAIKENQLPININLVISNNTNSPVLQKAEDNNIKNYIVNQNNSVDINLRLTELLKENNCEYIFLAGYMKKLDSAITDNFKVLNTHPALLPKHGGEGMYGRHVHQAVINSNDRVSGVTIHEVNSQYDSGEIILQKELHLAKDETVESLELKIKKLEKVAIVEGLVKYLNIS